MSAVRDRLFFEISGSYDIDLWDCHAFFQFLTSLSEENAPSFFYPEDGFSETLVTTYQTTQPHTLKDSNLHNRYFSRSS
jgi:hypothetical protein